VTIPMVQAEQIELAVLQTLKQDGPSTVDELVRRLPGFTWVQVFAAADRLDEQGKLILRHRAPYDYFVALSRADGSTRSDLGPVPPVRDG